MLKLHSDDEGAARRLFMVRHISMFFIKKEKKEARRLIIKKLQELEKKLGNITDYILGSDCMERFTREIPGVLEFGDIVQIIDFETVEEATAYPQNPGHIKLMEEVGEYVEKVTAIDIKLEEKGKKKV